MNPYILSIFVQADKLLEVNSDLECSMVENEWNIYLLNVKTHPGIAIA